jgi:hypothetical protein
MATVREGWRARRRLRRQLRDLVLPAQWWEVTVVDANGAHWAGDNAESEDALIAHAIPASVQRVQRNAETDDIAAVLVTRASKHVEVPSALWGARP